MACRESSQGKIVPLQRFAEWHFVYGAMLSLPAGRCQSGRVLRAQAGLEGWQGGRDPAQPGLQADPHGVLVGAGKGRHRQAGE